MVKSTCACVLCMRMTAPSAAADDDEMNVKRIHRTRAHTRISQRTYTFFLHNYTIRIITLDVCMYGYT